MKNLKKIDKYITYLLRHDPKKESLIMDKNGWIEVKDLIDKLHINIMDLDYIVFENDKQRFSYSDDKSKIRANQGHSIDVDVQLKDYIPPVILYHGTDTKYVDSILINGLKKQNRLHVHLSESLETAISVGERHGDNVYIFKINTLNMNRDGLIFYKSENNVWLTDFIDPKYFIF